jgi:hypothetical protein
MKKIFKSSFAYMTIGWVFMFISWAVENPIVSAIMNIMALGFLSISAIVMYIENKEEK